MHVGFGCCPFLPYLHNVPPIDPQSYLLLATVMFGEALRNLHPSASHNLEKSPVNSSVCMLYEKQLSE